MSTNRFELAHIVGTNVVIVTTNSVEVLALNESGLIIGMHAPRYPANPYGKTFVSPVSTEPIWFSKPENDPTSDNSTVTVDAIRKGLQDEKATSTLQEALRPIEDDGFICTDPECCDMNDPATPDSEFYPDTSFSITPAGREALAQYSVFDEYDDPNLEYVPACCPTCEQRKEASRQLEADDFVTKTVKRLGGQAVKAKRVVR